MNVVGEYVFLLDFVAFVPKGGERGVEQLHTLAHCHWSRI